ncbi:MAG: GNAT family N-acetyltransferase [Dehalococcoidia bacterium]|nr:GNAT family N-acetyltransferase [Dehalococcoidia bacterium]
MTTGASPRLDHLVVASAGVILIRHKHATDAFNDYQWRRDPDLARFDGNAPIDMSFSEFLERFERDLAFPTGDRRSYSLVLPGGRHIGNVMYYNADLAHTSAELGISIGDAECQGRSLGTAATVAFLRYLWATHAFRRIYLHTLEWNERAQRCFASAGFDRVARVSRKGQWFVKMEARREWWLLWDQEGRFEPILQRAAARNQANAEQPSPGSQSDR